MTKQYPSKQYLIEVSNNREFSEGVPPEIVIVMARHLLASMEQEPVALPDYMTKISAPTIANILANDDETPMANAARILAVEVNFWRKSPLYTAPQLPQPAVVPEMTACHAYDLLIKKSGVMSPVDSYACGWNDCRSAMLQGTEPVSQPYTLQNDQNEFIEVSQEVFHESINGISTAVRYPNMDDIAFEIDGAQAAYIIGKRSRDDVERFRIRRKYVVLNDG